jgi:hypothetical protein
MIIIPFPEKTNPWKGSKGRSPWKERSYLPVNRANLILVLFLSAWIFFLCSCFLTVSVIPPFYLFILLFSLGERFPS